MSEQTKAVARKDEWLDEITAALNRPDRTKLLEDMLGAGNVERFKAVAIHAIVSDSGLREASPLSVIEAVRESAALGLEPTGILGEAAIVVYGKVATLRPMWQGYLKLVRNSGQVAAVDCQVVYEKDEFDIQFGTESHVIHKPYIVTDKDDSRGNYRGAYAWARLNNGQLLVEWMNVADIEEVRKFSQARRSGPWFDFWGEMARKSVIRRFIKRLPKSPQLMRALEMDVEQDEAERHTPAPAISPARSAAMAALPEQFRADDLPSPENSPGDNIPDTEDLTDAELDELVRNTEPE